MRGVQSEGRRGRGRGREDSQVASWLRYGRGEAGMKEE